MLNSAVGLFSVSTFADLWPRQCPPEVEQLIVPLVHLRRRSRRPRGSPSAQAGSGSPVHKTLRNLVVLAARA